MMSHDPFQSYQTLGAGGGTPFGLPYTTPFLNPTAFGGPQIGTPGIGAYGIHPQQHMQGGAYPGLQNPLLQNALFQNPFLQNALLQNQLLQQHLAQVAAWQNPLIQQNPLLHQVQALQGWPQQQQQGWPQQQFGGYPLAPQSLIGAGGIGQQQGYGQIHPLAQLALRQAGCF